MTTTSTSAGNEKRKRIGASKPAPAPKAGTPATSYNGDDALPNEAEINTMGVAELRQAMLKLVHRHKSTHASALAEPCSLMAAVATSQYSSASCDRSEYLEDPAVTSNGMQVHKRHRNDSGASDTSQRMGIDLLLNASNFSDRCNNNNTGMLSMSPPSYSECRSSPPAISLSSSPPAHFTPPLDADGGYWNDT
ncbi:hypothetical protein GGI21_006065, partial [Coemansia aciculifera]